MNLPDTQTMHAREIVFGPVDAALASRTLRSPVLLVGTPRSVARISPAAFGDVEVVTFAGVAPHNPRTVVETAVALRDRNAVATVVAIGSSSAIDLGKALGDGSACDLVLVPTALGGAEMSRSYGVRDGDVKGGGRIARPAGVVIYDASLLDSLPARQLGSIGINAWAHAIEASYARKTHALGGAAALAAGRRLPALLRGAVSDRSTAMHVALFEAAHLAGFALDTRSMGLHHAVCHVIGGMTGIPHGIVNAIVLPHAVRANASIAPHAVAAVAEALGIADLAAEADSIARLYDLPRTLVSLDVNGDIVERCLPRVMDHPLLANNPARPSLPVVRALLESVYG